EAKKQGYDIRVETQGSIGIENALTEEEIRDAAIVILAVDKDINEKRFEGKRVYKVSTVKAINNTENIIKEAFNAPVFFCKNSGES
ncbi:PTS fructose transporter subunit IIB, partial [Borreliella garinii]